MKTFENRLIRDALERRTETKRKDPLFNQSMLAHAQRGFCGVGLEGRQTTANLGSVMRAAACFGSNFVAVHPGRLRHSRTDTQKGFRHIPLFQAEDLLALVPFGCEAVGVEVSDRAEDLTTFEHPQQAFYLFGPEGGSLSVSASRISAAESFRCRRRIV